MKLLKNRTIGFYIGSVAALFALVVDIIFIATNSQDRTFSMITFLLILLGIFFQIIIVFIDYKFIPIFPPVCYGAALAMHLYVGLPTLSDVWNGVNFIGGNPEAVVNFGIMIGIFTFASIVSSFMDQSKISNT